MVELKRRLLDAEQNRILEGDESGFLYSVPSARASHHPTRRPLEKPVASNHFRCLIIVCWAWVVPSGCAPPPMHGACPSTLGLTLPYEVANQGKWTPNVTRQP